MSNRKKHIAMNCYSNNICTVSESFHLEDLEIFKAKISQVVTFHSYKARISKAYFFKIKSHSPLMDTTGQKDVERQSHPKDTI